jgi:hypothetical protein
MKRTSFARRLSGATLGSGASGRVKTQTRRARTSRTAWHPIATRTLSLGDRRAPVVVSVGVPELDPKSCHGDWRCPFRISGLGPSRLRYDYGVDALQALLNVLAGIRHALEPHRSDLFWAGGGLDLAFPRFIPGGFPGRFAERIEKFIDHQLAGLTRTMERRAKKRAAQPAAAAARGRDRARAGDSCRATGDRGGR